MPLMRPDLDRDLYVAVLQRLFGIIEAWERTAKAGLPMRLRYLAEDRSRLKLLEEDLRGLGVSEFDHHRPHLPEFKNRAELLGAMYVMEGSRLGGQFIAKHVEASLGLSDGNGSRFFRGFGDATGRRWKEFTAVLESEVPDEQSVDAVRGAKKMFAAFGEWMSAVNVQHSARKSWAAAD